MNDVAVRNTPTLKCRICGCKLNEDEDDDLAGLLCSSCSARPEARRLGNAQSLGFTPPRTGAPRGWG